MIFKHSHDLIQTMSLTSNNSRRDALIYLLSLLKKRDHFIHEVTLKLTKKEFSKEIIDSVIEEAVTRKYLDDERSAKQLIREQKQKKKSRAQVRMKLIEKAGKEFGSAFSLDSQYSSSEEQEIIRILAASMLDRYDREKIMKRLYSRGFAYNQIKEIMHEIS